MNNFEHFLGPQEAKEFGDAHGNKRSLAYWQQLAKRKPRRCENCDELEWKYVDLGLCFSCVTGEADASNDSEITP